MRHSKSSLFLMEMIIVILFFSLSGAVCLRLFVKAHLLSKDTVATNHALICAQSLAESFLSTESDSESLAQLFPDATVTKQGLLIGYDEDWASCNPDGAVYLASLVYDNDLGTAGLIGADIAVYDNSQTYYSLHVEHYVQHGKE